MPSPQKAAPVDSSPENENEKSPKSSPLKGRAFTDEQFMVEVLRCIDGKVLVDLAQVAANCDMAKSTAKARLLKIKRLNDLDITTYWSSRKKVGAVPSNGAPASDDEAPASKTVATASSSTKRGPGRPRSSGKKTKTTLTDKTPLDDSTNRVLFKDENDTKVGNMADGSDDEFVKSEDEDVYA